MGLSSVMERTPFLVKPFLVFIPTGVVLTALTALRRSGPVEEDEEGDDVSVDIEVVA
jgi:hypothetical protein